MIEFVGSEYVYQGEQLAEPEIIFVRDHHYNETTCSFPVVDLLENSQCDPKLHTVIFDHVVQEDDVMSRYNCVYLPLFLARSVQQFENQNIVPDWSAKTTKFNFMINKIRTHRTFLLMLIEHFKLTDYEYTLCWKNTRIDRSRMARESQYGEVINNARLDFPTRQYLFGSEILLDQGLRYGHLTNSQVYQQFLQSNVFEPTSISLITEPAFYERETIITEKTIMSIYAGTVPIWVGGWRCPDYMRSMGFDVFDDIVDHSYQALSDPYDRCFRAIELNLDLLKNFTAIDYMPRLVYNLNLLKTNPFLLDCQRQLTQLPVETQNIFTKIW